MKPVNGIGRSAAAATHRENERGIRRLRRHPVIFAKWLIMSVPPLLIVAGAAAATQLAAPQPRLHVLTLCFVVSGLWILIVLVRWFSVSITLTDADFIVASGIASRVTEVVLLESVQSITVRQSVLGRLLDNGVLEIHHFGSSSPSRFGPVALSENKWRDRAEGV